MDIPKHQMYIWRGFKNNKTTKKLIFKYTCQKMFDLKNNNV